MNSVAFVFCYKRAEVLKECLRSIFEESKYVPDEVICIDDASPTSCGVQWAVVQAQRKYSNLQFWTKGSNRGLSDSAQIAFNYVREKNPQYVFLIEGDYIYRRGGMDDLTDLFRNTTQGNSCLGVVGYDHPNFYHSYIKEIVFPRCMVQQVGEDNVNRDVLHKPFKSPSGNYHIELVSNTCWTSYLHWWNIQKVAREFPELWDLLDQAIWPRDNPNYPDSGNYKAARVVDDGMLSHALSLCWNNWALEHRFDRTRHAAWLNIKPSIATHVLTGGMHS